MAALETEGRRRPLQTRWAHPRCVPGLQRGLEEETLARDMVLNERHFVHSPEVKQEPWAQGGYRVMTWTRPCPLHSEKLLPL